MPLEAPETEDASEAIHHQGARLSLLILTKILHCIDRRKQPHQDKPITQQCHCAARMLVCGGSLAAEWWCVLSGLCRPGLPGRQGQRAGKARPLWPPPTALPTGFPTSTPLPSQEVVSALPNPLSAPYSLLPRPQKLDS